MGLHPVERLNSQEGVCPLIFRVLVGASGIRWRSVTLLLLGRTTGVLEPYATAL
jgi:hypothetical protein